ncbi:MAG TPA: BrnT family toxin [Nevskiaceae bacterium]|nr:BrnT family toxin [Nevskiaceae bacterium]
MMRVDGFDWDTANWPKCGKHGISKAEIESLFTGSPAVASDPCLTESRQRAIGKAHSGRYVFAVFTLRTVDDQTLIRPISARYMHQKEVTHYVRT